MCLQPYGVDDEPAPPGLGGPALVAVRRILAEILAAEEGSTVELVAPAGAFELIPLRFVFLDDGDLGAVGEAVAALGVALLAGGDKVAAAVVGEFADDHRGGTPGDVVATFARAHAHRSGVGYRHLALGRPTGRPARFGRCSILLRNWLTSG